MVVRFQVDAQNPTRLPRAEAARLDALSDAEIDAAANGDADNPPLTKVELDHVAGAATIRRIRADTGLSQSAFAATYRINLGRLRDLEQGRTQPDSALMAYMRVISREPDAVRRALSAVV